MHCPVAKKNWTGLLIESQETIINILIRSVFFKNHPSGMNWVGGLNNFFFKKKGNPGWPDATMSPTPLG